MDFQVGSTFATWDEFLQALEVFSKRTFTVWTIRSNRSVAAANKRLKLAPYYKKALVNAYAKLCCKHFGFSKSASSGQRPEQRTFRNDCPAYMHVTASCADRASLRITALNTDHNHDCSADSYYCYPEARRMAADVEKEVSTMINLGVNTGIIRQHLKQTQGISVINKDIQNVKEKVRRQKTSPEDEELVEVINSLIRNKPEASVHVKRCEETEHHEKSLINLCTFYSAKGLSDEEMLYAQTLSKYASRAVIKNMRSSESCAMKDSYQTTEIMCKCAAYLKKGFPCKHIFKRRAEMALPLYDISLVEERWHENQCDVPATPGSVPATDTEQPKKLSKLQKYKEALTVCKQIADTMSEQTMERYTHMLRQLERLLESWQSDQSDDGAEEVPLENFTVVIEEPSQPAVGPEERLLDLKIQQIKVEDVPLENFTVIKEELSHPAAGPEEKHLDVKIHKVKVEDVPLKNFTVIKEELSQSGAGPEEKHLDVKIHKVKEETDEETSLSASGSCTLKSLSEAACGEDAVIREISEEEEEEESEDVDRKEAADSMKRLAEGDTGPESKKKKLPTKARVR